MALVPCDSCRRHVRAGDAACPFCKAVRTAAAVAVTAAAALAIAGCDTFSPASKYGGPPEAYREPDAATPVTIDPPVASTSPSTPTPTPTPPAPPAPSESTASPTPPRPTTSPRLDPPPSATEKKPPRPPGGDNGAPAAMYGAPPRR